MDREDRHQIIWKLLWNKGSPTRLLPSIDKYIYKSQNSDRAFALWDHKDKAMTLDRLFKNSKSVNESRCDSFKNSKSVNESRCDSFKKRKVNKVHNLVNKTLKYTSLFETGLEHNANGNGPRFNNPVSALVWNLQRGAYDQGDVWAGESNYSQ